MTVQPSRTGKLSNRIQTAKSEELENCFTRLRVNVKNPDLINEDLINHVPNSGINRNGNNIQIIFGMKVAEMRDKVENAIEKEQ